jgi:Response regulators consisting of a CheY-like receiver domain and a winged-helix DNA-binding domain
MKGLTAECPGIEFLEAGTFTAGKLLAEIQPSLVILDAALTGIDGRRACKLIKSDRRLKKARIIAVTAPGDAGTRRLLLEAGADDCLPKPLKIRMLAESVKKIFP